MKYDPILERRKIAKEKKMKTLALTLALAYTLNQINSFNTDVIEQFFFPFTTSLARNIHDIRARR